MDTQDSAQQVPARTLGQVLAAERERQGLSRADAAQRLHMSAYQVEALETGDYTRLPRGTFLRGFVRNYAKLLGIAPDDVLPLLQESGPHDERPEIVVPTQNIRFDPLSDRFSNPYVKAAALAVVAVSIAFATMYWWLFVRPTPPATAAKKPAELPTSALVSAPEIVAKAPIATAAAPTEANAPVGSAKADTPAAASAPPEPPKAEAKKAEPAKADAKKAEPPKPEAKKAETKTVAGTPGPGTLKFHFKGESWVEIRDAKGRVLFSKLNAPGSEAEVSGNPPFRVVVGNAPEVQLLYNDHEFNLEPHTNVAVARFTVE